MTTELFGEKVWFKELKTKAEQKDKAETEWFEGLWLGHARSSNETLIGTRQGVVRAWAIRKQSPEDRWDSILIKEMRGTPQKPNPNKPGGNIPVKITFDAVPQGIVPPIIVPAGRKKHQAKIYVHQRVDAGKIWLHRWVQRLRLQEGRLGSAEASQSTVPKANGRSSRAG